MPIAPSTPFEEQVDLYLLGNAVVRETNRGAATVRQSGKAHVKTVG
jgi:hypothetical protein